VFCALFACLSLAAGSGAQAFPGSSLQASLDPVDLSAGGCSPDWIGSFGPAPGVNGQLQDMLEHDDGSGPALYVAGFFTTAGSVPARSVARWDGFEWTALADGLEGGVYALEVYDDGLGGGPALYAGGTFTDSGGTFMSRVARWDGAAWSEVGVGPDNIVNALEVHEGALFAGGEFHNAGGVVVNHVARWDGINWTPLGAGTPEGVYALHSYDDGGGADLYVGGNWSPTVGFPHDHLARWDGLSWSDVDGGVSGIVWAMETYDSGTGPELMVSGQVFSAGTSGVPTSGIAAWDGSAWSAPFIPSTTGVQDMAVGNLGGGDVLLLVGNILDNVAQWDGEFLTPLGDGLGPFVDCVTVFDTGSGPTVAVGGPFDSDFSAYGIEHVAQWTGSDWAPVGGPGFSGGVRALHNHDDGNGPALFIGGNFGFPGGGPSHGIARLHDGLLTDMGGTIGQPILDFATYDDGTSVDLYACGKVLPLGGSFLDIAAWNGSSWTEIGDVQGGGITYDLHVHDDGSGSALYVAGNFAGLLGVTAANIARWDGSSWSAVGSGPGATVLAMATYDDGTGSQLYVGGTFTMAGGGVADYIARWDGATWTGLGGGPIFGSGHAVRALQVVELFGEEHLYVGGTFDNVNGMPDTESLARFDGSGWSALPFAGITGDVHALTVDYDSIFRRLVVGGEFEGVGLNDISNLAAWTGIGWANYGGGVDELVQSLAVADVDDGLGPVLTVGGNFTHQLNSPVQDAGVARWGACWAGDENWTDLGFALGGTFGDPLLEGSGSLAPWSWNEVNLSNAFPSAFSGLFLSFSSTPIPFMGGTLVPNPFLDPPIFATTTASGDIPLGFLMPADIPTGTEIFVQWAIQDPGGPSGVALSNALRGDVP
jgi:hypothetical protein